MKIGRYIKKFREQQNLSQEQLADKLYVSRQTVSSWENGHTYPDLQNILMLSVLFNVSVDELIKGDVLKMKQKIESKRLNRWIIFWFLLLFLSAVSVPVAFRFYENNDWVILIPILSGLMTLFTGLKIERIKKDNHIRTYDEIIAFMEGKDISHIQSDSRKEILPSLYYFGGFILIVIVGMLFI